MSRVAFSSNGHGKACEGCISRPWRSFRRVLACGVLSPSKTSVPPRRRGGTEVLEGERTPHARTRRKERQGREMPPSQAFPWPFEENATRDIRGHLRAPPTNQRPSGRCAPGEAMPVIFSRPDLCSRRQIPSRRQLDATGFHGLPFRGTCQRDGTFVGEDIERPERKGLNGASRHELFAHLDQADEFLRGIRKRENAEVWRSAFGVPADEGFHRL